MQQAQVGVSIILINKKMQVLIGKRKGSHGAGLYSIPGGHIEFKETYDQCCDRELMEEIGVNFGSYKKVGFSEDFFVKNGEDKHYTTLYFVVEDIDSDNIEIKNLEPEKCEGWEWKHVSDLPEVMFCDTFNQIKNYVFRKWLKKN